MFGYIDSKSISVIYAKKKALSKADFPENNYLCNATMFRNHTKKKYFFQFQEWAKVGWFSYLKKDFIAKERTGKVSKFEI